LSGFESGGYYYAVQSRTDSELMIDYAERGCEAAFSELVRRYIDLVYSAALRMTRDPHLAQDVTQGAFAALAKSACQLAGRPVLSAWLHRSAQNIAAQSIRSEIRRRAREQEAHAMSPHSSAELETPWEEIAPHLDQAVGQLSDPDRDAVMLRYFEGKTAREIAERLGISEEAAQKRVHRAVERLREFFAKRGVPITAGGFAVISAQAVQSAPAGLFAAISSAALITGAAGASSLVTTTVNTVTWMNAKSLATAAVAALVTGSGVYLTKELLDDRRLEEHRAASQAEIARLQKVLGESAQVQITDAELNRLRAEQRDAIKLRGEITNLKQSLAAAQKAVGQNSINARTNLEDLLKTEPLPESNPEVRVHSTKVIASRVPSGSAIAVGGWISSSGRRLFAFVQPRLIDPRGVEVQPGSGSSEAGEAQISVNTKWAELPPEVSDKHGLGKYLDTSGDQTLTVDSATFKDWIKQFESSEGIDLLSGPVVTTLSGRQARLSVTEMKDTAAGPVEFGPLIDVIPTLSDDGMIELVFKASLTESASAPKSEDESAPKFRLKTGGVAP
jgi:RNA polymerase sigma factor (sigma-70 family)